MPAQIRERHRTWATKVVLDEIVPRQLALESRHMTQGQARVIVLPDYTVIDPVAQALADYEDERRRVWDKAVGGESDW